MSLSLPADARHISCPAVATPSAQFSLTLRVELPHESGTLSKVTAAITRVGGAIIAVDTVEAGGEGTLREITIVNNAPNTL